jgi:flagellar biosynthetic protein FlhB
MADDEEKTEEPTSKKIEDARAEGNVGKSAEVAGAVILTLGSVYLIFLSGFMFLEIKKVMLYIYGFIGQELDESTYFTITVTVATTLIKALAPIYLLVFVLALAANWMQFGFIATPLKFDLQKLDPIKGMQNVFSLKKLMEALKLTLKLAVIVWVMFLLFSLTYQDFLTMMNKELNATIEPMATLGGEKIVTLDDNWTISTRDGSIAAHFEHTVLITESGAEILTRA